MAPPPIWVARPIASSALTRTINKNQAFQVNQLVDLADLPAASFYGNTAVVLAGTNVYTMDDVNGTNDPISDSLPGTLIKRVQALYKHPKNVCSVPCAGFARRVCVVRGGPASACAPRLARRR